MLLIFCKESLG